MQNHYQQTIDELSNGFSLYPQKTVNVEVSSKPDINTNKAIMKTLKEQEKALGNKGRILLRYSGTEPLIRVMVEAESQKLVKNTLDVLVKIVKDELGS